MFKSILIPLIACLTLGLAPFSPEPHVLGKLRWILGGGVGMKPIDWFDTILHGSPFIWLIIVSVNVTLKKIRANKQS